MEGFLKERFPGTTLEILNRQLTTKGKPGRGIKYSSELKSFALTLQFYSSKAYDYVRKSLNYALPDKSVIRSWYSKISAGPGFTKPAFSALKVKVLFD